MGFPADLEIQQGADAADHQVRTGRGICFLGEAYGRRAYAF